MTDTSSQQGPNNAQRTSYRWIRAARSIAHGSAVFALATVTFLVVGSSSGTLAAATTFTIQPDITNTADGALAVIAADVDGDGRIDLASASGVDDTIAWYRQEVDGTFTRIDIDTTAQGANSVVAADLDDDGRIDLASASGVDDTIAWYRQEVDGTFTKIVITTTADGAASVTAADLDGDGRIDLASASAGDDTIAWYRQEDDGTFTKIVVTSTADGTESVVAADLDGDGRIDLASAAFVGDTIAWYRQLDDGTFTTEIAIDTAADGARKVAAADLNGDGRIDLALASFNDDTFAWYRNDGGTFTVQPDIATADGAADVAAADLDNDGDLDLALASYLDDTLVWYENDGDGSFTSQPAIDTTADQAVSVAGADIDDDGDIDLALASRNDDTVAWYRNDPTEAPTVDAGGAYTVADGDSVELAATTSDPDGGTPSLAWDFDGDGGFDDATGLTPTYDTTVFGAPGANTIAVEATDNEGATATDTATITITITITITSNGVDPVVDAGGPYTVADGDSVELAATTSDPDGGTPSLAWDFDGDGGFDDATGLTPTYDTTVFGAPGANTIAVQAIDNEGATATDTATITITSDPVDPVVDAVTSLEPARFADTRPGGETFDHEDEGEGRRPANSEYRVQIAGRGGVPAGASAVVVYITAVQPGTTGYVTAHPCVSPRPNASSLNYTAAVNVGNEVIIPLGSSGELCVYTSASIHLILDVAGYVDAASPIGLITPARFLDTRPNGTTIDGVGQRTGRVGAGTGVTLRVAGRGDIPDDAVAAIVNVTAIQADQIGFITAHACLATLPNTSSLNYTAGVNRGNEIIVELDANGDLCLFTSADVHLTADVAGYLPAGSNLTTIAPSRLIDTRADGDTIDGMYEGLGSLGADMELRLPVAERAGIPASATAVVVYVTSVRAQQIGYITVHPCNDPRPNTASLNYIAGVNGGNEIIIQLDATGDICIYTSAATHLTVDVTAYTDE